MICHVHFVWQCSPYSASASTSTDLAEVLLKIILASNTLLETMNPAHPATLPAVYLPHPPQPGHHLTNTLVTDCWSALEKSSNILVRMMNDVT